ncbi:unnamed protein product [Amoebophrya sp. A120]|nr:unnamed protein product [Amoebophrya sp. A120]|eukprot:GSA120T00015196001.1
MGTKDMPELEDVEVEPEQRSTMPPIAAKRRITFAWPRPDGCFSLHAPTRTPSSSSSCPFPFAAGPTSSSIPPTTPAAAHNKVLLTAQSPEQISSIARSTRSQPLSPHSCIKDTARACLSLQKQKLQNSKSNDATSTSSTMKTELHNLQPGGENTSYSKSKSATSLTKDTNDRKHSIRKRKRIMGNETSSKGKDRSLAPPATVSRRTPGTESGRASRSSRTAACPQQFMSKEAQTSKIRGLDDRQTCDIVPCLSGRTHKTISARTTIHQFLKTHTIPVFSCPKRTTTMAAAVLLCTSGVASVGGGGTEPRPTGSAKGSSASAAGAHSINDERIQASSVDDSVRGGGGVDTERGRRSRASATDHSAAPEILDATENNAVRTALGSSSPLDETANLHAPPMAHQKDAKYSASSSRRKTSAVPASGDSSMSVTGAGHAIERNAVKIAKARAPPMRQLCPRGDTKEICRLSNKNQDALENQASAPTPEQQQLHDRPASGDKILSDHVRTASAPALHDPAPWRKVSSVPAGLVDDRRDMHKRRMDGHAPMPPDNKAAALLGAMLMPKGLLGTRIYSRIKAGTLQLADPMTVNATVIRNTTFTLPVQPPSTRIYKKTQIMGSNLGDYATPVPIDFEDLDQDCKNAVTNFVIYEGIDFANDECRNHCQLKPFHTTWPTGCQHDVCDLWVKMLTKEATGNAPCRKYICYIAPYLEGYTADDAFRHCGPRFLRDAYTFCDWTQRGASMWAGQNSRVPGQLYFPRKAYYSSYQLRGTWSALTTDEKDQYKVEAVEMTSPTDGTKRMVNVGLGWDETSWGNRRFTSIFAGDASKDVYEMNVTTAIKQWWYPWCPASEFMCYDELSDGQRDAVRKLHYTIDGWHMNADIPGIRDHCNWPRFLAQQGVYRADGPRYSCMRWREFLEAPLHRQFSTIQYRWTDLTKQRQEAYTTLNYVNTPQQWDQRDIPDKFVVEWSKLTTAEQGAAEFLMYTEDTWNGCPEEECIFRLLYAEKKLIPTRSTEFRALQWNRFADFQKVHLEQLGWQADSWNDGGPIPAAFFRTWQELEPALQKIASKYGHREDTWSRCPNTPCLLRYDYIQQKYQGPWQLLSPRVQRTFAKLGWTQQMWDDKQSGASTELPDTYRKLWKDLTNDEKIDAQFFDYDEFSWNGCAGADQEKTTTVAPPSTEDPFRRIRARLYMPRSYNEIMSVSPTTLETTTPPPAVVVSTSSGTTTTPPDSSSGFVAVAQQAIARTLFCNNPPYSATTNPDQRDPNGMPLCMDKDPYDRQLMRINVLNVGQGILMDFEILANRTAKEVSAVHLYERLQAATTNPQSDFRHDADFQRFSSVGQLSMLTFSEEEFAEEQANLQFEVLRAQYDEEKACELFSDKKNGVDKCPKDSAATFSVMLPLVAVVFIRALIEAFAL